MKKQGLVTGIMLSALTLAATNVQAGWPEKVDFAGSVIAEFGFISTDATDTTDLTVYEVYFNMNAELSESVSATVGLLYEEAGTAFGVDEAYITWMYNDALTFQGGQMMLPFGRFNSAMVNDSFALTLGEIYETAAMATYGMGAVTLSGYFFNGAVHEDNNDGNPAILDDQIEAYGLRAMFGSEEMNLAVDYISNLADADIYSGVPFGATDVEVADVAAGVAVSGHVGGGNMSFDFEYLSALDPIGGGNGEVESIGVEFGYTLDGDCACAVGFAVQTSDDAAALLPETRISFGYGRSFAEVLGLNVELFVDEGYTDAGDATGLVIDVAASF